MQENDVYEASGDVADSSGHDAYSFDRPLAASTEETQELNSAQNQAVLMQENDVYEAGGDAADSCAGAAAGNDAYSLEQPAIESVQGTTCSDEPTAANADDVIMQDNDVYEPWTGALCERVLYRTELIYDCVSRL